MANTHFCRKIHAGEAIKPFMVSGVLEKEYTGSRSGGETVQFREAAFREAVEKCKDISFREFDTFEFFGMKGQWKTVDTPAPRYADGKYYIMERLSIMPIYLEIESDTEQETGSDG